jgi:hypothetical protein
MPISLSPSKRYAPRGEKHLVRVEFGVEPEERAEADRLAQAMGTTRSALLREVYLLGIPLLRAQHPATTPNEA